MTDGSECRTRPRCEQRPSIPTANPARIPAFYLSLNWGGDVRNGPKLDLVSHTGCRRIGHISQNEPSFHFESTKWLKIFLLPWWTSRICPHKSNQKSVWPNLQILFCSISLWTSRNKKRLCCKFDTHQFSLSILSPALSRHRYDFNWLPL